MGEKITEIDKSSSRSFLKKKKKTNDISFAIRLRDGRVYLFLRLVIFVLNYPSIVTNYRFDHPKNLKMI